MARRPITVEDLWKIRRPSQPTVSPDGAQACVSLTEYDMEENKGRASLWLLSTFGGTPRRLTTCGEKDGEPRWSPDGRHIAFVAKRDGDDEPQVWVIAPDGGEARRVTRMPTGAGGIKWFPDSKRIAFISRVWPDARGYAALAERHGAHKASKVKANVAEHAAYRHWDHWLCDGRVPRLFIAHLDHERIVDLFAGTRYELPEADTSASDYDISPDGRELAFAFDPAGEKRFDHAYELVALDLRAKAFRSLTRGSRLGHGSPSYSPDGRRLALLACDLRRSATAESRIALVDRATGRLEVLPWAWDRSANAPLAWEPDSSALLFTAEDQARTHLFRWALGDRLPVVVARGGTVSEFSAAAGTRVFVRNTMSTPPAVFAGTGSGAEAKLEDFNDELLSGLAMGKVEERRFRGWNGEEVQMWLVYPPGHDGRRQWPLLHNIHGGPHAIWGDNFHPRWNNQVFAAQGYVVACVNYHGSSSFGQRFLESIDREFGRREFADIEAATDFLLREGGIDRRRLLAAGGSYGGYMVAWMNGHTDRYRAYVCHAGCFDWVAMFADDAWYWHPKELGAFYWDDPARVASQNPRERAGRMRTPTLVMHGLLDYRVPDAQGLAYYNTLKAMNVPARLVHFPDENHWILKPQNSRLWYREFHDWLARFVKPGPGGGRAAPRAAARPRPGSR